MIVSATVSPLWRDLPGDFASRLGLAVEKGLAAAPKGRARIFFRADDVAVPGHGFTALTELFERRQAPLCLAVVPAWLTANRYQALKASCKTPGLWCWCQHGWRHMNFEAPGAKKREFGAARPAKDKRQDIARGAARMQEILGAEFTPVFSPPWNRCDGQSMAHMPALGVKALSRTVGAGPDAPAGLPDFPVCADVNTRKEADPDQSLNNLLAEVETGLASGLCGVMLHHQRQNAQSLAFLDAVLAALAGKPGARLVHFGQLLAERDG